ncbi:MAG: beta-ketoacyl-[acyl-carrier-protein] synthase family protein [Chitinispirillaceae bacterium]
MTAMPITGLGAVCAAGDSVESSMPAIIRGEDGLTPLRLFDSGLKQVPLCGQVEDSETCRRFTKHTNRTTAFGVMAAEQALKSFADRSGLRLGLVLATTVAGMRRSERFLNAYRKDPQRIFQAGVDLSEHEPTVVSGTIARHFKAEGFHTISTACSTGLHAIGMAKRLLEQNHYDLCLAVGTDALSLLTVRGFASLMLIDFDGCKPFDKKRVGISLGEGAGAVLMARPEVVKTYRIPVHAYVSGWGASADCYHMTAPHPQGNGARKAVMRALEESKLSPDDIDFIAAHGTATPDNDSAEIQAMKTLFASLPPFCSLKRTLGHTLAASGILEAVFAIQAMEHGIVPPTAGFMHTDDNIGAEPSPGEKKDINNLLKNSFGFGGNNAAVIFSRRASNQE